MSPPNWRKSSLDAFDPELRKQLGVWYTPSEIVRYMVARVDTVLRTELGVMDGLADPSVFVLDPCCGTGTYLVEVLNHIHATQIANGMGALAGQMVKQAATARVFGFEILPAPFVVSHLQLGLLLQSLGAPLATRERAGVYLTNALTGWEPPEGAKQRLPMREFEDERDAAEKVKRDTPILVVIGNPPYNAYAGTSPEAEHGLIEPYQRGLVREWGIKRSNLNDLYVRFLRIAERRIAEQTGKGMVCYISNFSYLRDSSFVVMRERLLREFDALWFDNLNGDSRETGKTTPEGAPDPSVFSTEHNREGIRVGTVVGLMVRKPTRSTTTAIRYREFWGTSKRSDLEASLAVSSFDAQYQTISPTKTNRYSFRPSTVTEDYHAWPSVHDLADFKPALGVLENRKNALISIDRAPLESRMRVYLDPSRTLDSLRAVIPGLTTPAARFEPGLARTRLMAAGPFDESAIRPMMARAMDRRLCYYTAVRPIWNESRADYVRQSWPGNAALVTRRKAVAVPEGVPFFFVSIIGDQHAFLKDAYYVPLMLRREAKPSTGTDGQTDFLDQVEEVGPVTTANLSPTARAYLTSIGVRDPDTDMETASLLWRHVLAIGYAPAYLSEHEDGIRADWPRIPLPVSEEHLRGSAELGKQLATFLDTEQPVANVTSGMVRPELRVIADLKKVDGGPPNPNAGDFDLRARWGYASTNGIIMGGAGKLIRREYDEDELQAITAGASALGLTLDQALDCLGTTTCDIFLNDRLYWKNVPTRVWDFTIGGYPVMKKWLSYREYALLNRRLELDEVRHVIGMARRLAAVRLLEPALDANYLAVAATAYAWPSDGGQTTVEQA